MGCDALVATLVGGYRQIPLNLHLNIDAPIDCAAHAVAATGTIRIRVQWSSVVGTRQKSHTAGLRWHPRSSIPLCGILDPISGLGSVLALFGEGTNY